MARTHDEAELAETERLRLRALVNADVTAADRTPMRTTSSSRPQAEPCTRKTSTSERSSREDIDYRVWEPLDIDVRVRGDAGCVRYHSNLEIVVAGRAIGTGAEPAHRLLRATRRPLAGDLVPRNRNHRWASINVASLTLSQATRQDPHVGSPAAKPWTCSCSTGVLRVRRDAPDEARDTCTGTDQPRKSEAHQVRLNTRPAGVAADGPVGALSPYFAAA